MNIGIDIDGVLTDIHAFNHRHAPPFFKKKYNLDVVDEIPWDIREIFHCSDKELLAFMKRYALKYAIMEPARNGAKEFTRKLRKDGHLIYIISKRAFSSRKDFLGTLMRALVRNWLWRNGIRYHEILFCDANIEYSKRVACISRKIDVMLEDEILNINSISSIVKVICFDTAYNRECAGKNISRASDFDEAYEFIKSLTKQQRTNKFRKLRRILKRNTRS